MRICTLLLVFVVIAVITVDAARVRGGGSRGGSKSSRGSSRSRSSSSSKTRISKTTPIKATTFRSSVIKLQTTHGSRSKSSIFKTVLMAYFLRRYVLSSAPVYRDGYPMYGSYVSFPAKRAVRLSSEEEKLLDLEGDLCIAQENKEVTLPEDINKYLVDLNTTVKYKNTGRSYTFRGINKTVSLEDIEEEDFEVTSRALYNTTLVPKTSCRQIEKKMEGTMVHLYETNPDGSSTLIISSKLFLAALFLFVFLFKPL